MVERLFFDIGSTVIKAVRLGDDGRVVERRFVDRVEGVDAEAEVRRSIGDHLGPVRICSSALGGVRVGIVCLTARYSGAAAAQVVRLAGGRVVFCREIDSALAEGEVWPTIDRLVLVGGIDEGAPGWASAALERLAASLDGPVAVIHAGAAGLRERVRALFPGAVILANLLDRNLAPAGGELAAHLSAVGTRLLGDPDLMMRLAGVSEVEILTTPEIVSAALAQAEGDGVIVVDIGGTTTEVHPSRDLLGRCGDAVLAREGRRVFTGLGVGGTRESTLAQLRDHANLFDLFEAIHGDAARSAYLAFQEGRHEAALAAHGCCFLALTRLLIAGEAAAIDARQVRRVIVTGGGARMVEAATLARVGASVALLAGGDFAVEADVSGEWWVAGLAAQPPLRASR